MDSAGSFFRIIPVKGKNREDYFFSSCAQRSKQPWMNAMVF